MIELLSDADILDILYDWNFWGGHIYTGVPREEYVEEIIRATHPNRVVSVIGVRRSGKSFILRQVAKRISETSGPENVLLVNFEDPRFGEADFKLLDRILAVYLREIGPGGRPYLVLDEIQNVAGWERWVRTVTELGRANVIISGSSARLLSPELATSLTGRHTTVRVFPLSFREFLRFKGIPEDRPSRMRVAVKEYLEYGGFPEVVLSSDKKRILLGYFEDIVLRDVVMRFGVDRPVMLKELARFYMTAVSKPVTFRSIQGFMNMAVGTIEKYTHYLETAWLIFFVRRYYEKVKEQIRAPRKVYAIDVGLPNVIGFRITRNVGQSFENLVAVDILRLTRVDPRVEVYYWQSQGREVDFVIKLGDEIIALVEVSFELDPSSMKKKASALVSAGKKLGCEELFLVTYGEEGAVEKGGMRVRVVPYWRWATEVLDWVAGRIALITGEARATGRSRGRDAPSS